MSIATDLDIFVSGKGEELCDKIANRLGIDKPDDGWPDYLIDAIEEELKGQIHDDSEAMFTDYMNNHGSGVCTDAFESNYEPEEGENDE